MSRRFLYQEGLNTQESPVELESIDKNVEHFRRAPMNQPQMTCVGLAVSLLEPEEF